MTGAPSGAAGDLPRYADLPDGDAVGVFGQDDVLGSLNRLTPDVVRHAATLVRSGEVFSLNAPMTWPDPPLYNREPLQHTVYRTALGNLDDRLDSFYPQASSQWDAFPHIRDPEVGFYNRQPTERLGIESWAERGIAGRGVLLDMGAFLAEVGTPLHWRTGTAIGVAQVEAYLAARGVEKLPGDVLVLRTGWTAGYRAADEAERAAVRTDQTSPGLEGCPEMLEYLWDWGISAVAGDNVAVETLPPSAYPLHPHLLNRLGIPIGELWDLERLAAACAADGRYEFLLVSAPLNVPGGIGSPANALALR